MLIHTHSHSYLNTCSLRYGRSNIAVTLIKNGANLHLKDTDGNTAVSILSNVLSKLEGIKETGEVKDWTSEHEEMLIGYRRIDSAIKARTKKDNNNNNNNNDNKTKNDKKEL